MNKHLPEHPRPGTEEVPPVGASPTEEKVRCVRSYGAEPMTYGPQAGETYWVSRRWVDSEGNPMVNLTTFGTRAWAADRFVPFVVAEQSSDPFGFSNAAKDTNPKAVYGEAKAPMGIVPGAALVECSLVMQLGNVKYGPANWRKDPVSFSTYFHALQRHAYRVWDGEDVDPESGRPHMAHVMANAAILLDAHACGTLIDDRPPRGATATVIEETTRQGKVAVVR